MGKNKSFKIQKVNRMTTEQIKSKMFELEQGQTHIYENSNGDEVHKVGASHKNSKYYIHLQEELDRRDNKTA